MFNHENARTVVRVNQGDAFVPMNGVSVKVVAFDARDSHHDRPVRMAISDDGFIGSRFRPGDTIGLELCVAANMNVLVVNVDGQKNVTPAENLSREHRQSVYRLKMVVKPGSRRSTYVKYPENNIRMLQFNGDGSFQLWEVAVVAQNGNYFITSQVTWEGQCYYEDGRVTCPIFDEWSQMCSVLEDFVSKFPGMKAALPRRRISSPKTDPNTEGLQTGYGRVLWYTLSMGLGAIQTKDGVVRVHFSVIRSNSRLAALHAGQIVRITGTKPVTSSRSTSFASEATEVIPQ